ncbi:MAG: hypothetical protein N3G21_04035 [Candidatus Hydrogenedentes bacterium]|nr:hypothetical protein [Candidatus Hydrogenedentota bacterium]
MVRFNRRNFIKSTLLTSLVGNASLVSGEEKLDSQALHIPCGKIGELKISRLLLGGNLLTHFTHSRDLKYVYNLCANYNTPQKIVETMQLAEKHGINTLVVHTVPQIMKLLEEYRYKKGGRIQWIICPTAYPDADFDLYKSQVKQLVDMGTDAIYLWGVTADRLVKENKIPWIKKCFELVKEYNLPSGIGAHDLDVVRVCLKENIIPDFFIKTFHHHNYPTAPRKEQLIEPYSEIPGYWCRDPEETVQVMQDVPVPWIAFKVMAAGAIPPTDAFPYAFSNGADFVLAGMFDFEIEEDVRIVNEALQRVDRKRKWVG